MYNDENFENYDINNVEAFVKRLQLQNMELQSQLDGLKEIYTESNNRYQEVLNKVNSFCKKILQKDFALSQIDGYDDSIKNMDYNELLDYIAEKIIEEKVNQNTAVLKLIEEKNAKDKIIEDLKNQICELSQKANLTKQEVMEILNDNKIESSTEDIVASKEDTADDKKDIVDNNIIKEEIESDALQFAFPASTEKDEEQHNDEENIKKQETYQRKNILEENIEKAEEIPSTTIIVKDKDIEENLGNPKAANRQDKKHANTNRSNINTEHTNNNHLNTNNSTQKKSTINPIKLSEKNSNNNIKSDSNESISKIGNDLKKPISKNNKYNKSNNSTSNTEDYYVINLKNIANDLAEIHWDVIEAIGVYGNSEKVDILNHIKGKYLDISEESLDQKLIKTLEELKISDIVSKERVNTGVRMFFIYNITETGKKIYTNYAKDPKAFTESESTKLLKMHSSLKHGYTIKDSAKILMQLGYKDVTYTEDENKITLDNGDIYIPDIIGTNPKTGEKMYFEVEFGFHSQSEFDAKCNKIAKISSTINFIVVDVKRRNNVSFQIKSWLLSLNGSNKHITTRITTTRNLRNDAWEIESL